MSGDRQSIEEKELIGQRVRATKSRWDTNDLIAALRDAARDDGYLSHAMYRRAYEAKIGTKHRLPSASAYWIRWGSWDAALAAAGLNGGKGRDSYSRRSLTDLAADVAAAGRALGGPPSVAEYVAWRTANPARGLASCALIRRRFGGWPAALRAAVDVGGPS